MRNLGRNNIADFLVRLQSWQNIGQRQKQAARRISD